MIPEVWFKEVLEAQRRGRTIWAKFGPVPNYPPPTRRERFRRWRTRVRYAIASRIYPEIHDLEENW